MNTERLLEEEILASFERGEWKPIRNQKGEIARFRATAEATLLKDKRVNIRISSETLRDCKPRPLKRVFLTRLLWRAYFTSLCRVVSSRRKDVSLHARAGQRASAPPLSAGIRPHIAPIHHSFLTKLVQDLYAHERKR